MADAKKPDKKDAKPATAKSDPFAEIVTWIFLAFLAMYMINGFAQMFSNGTFSHGWQGLTPHGIIAAHTQPVSFLENPIGTRVVSMSDDTSVYDSPGGKEIGTQPFNSRGKILQGYVEVNGQKYWYVDFDNGSDGWVRESDIANLQSEPTMFEKILLWGWSVIPSVKIFSVLFSLALMLFAAYVVVKLTEIRKNQHALLYPASAESAGENIGIVNPKWEKILAQIESLNENDWKLAVIEADTMLADILDKLHLPGETMGDKMKAVEKSDFTTIDMAWEAHKIRNQIAHEGSDFVLVQREARRVIALYQAVFEEFQII